MKALASLAIGLILGVIVTIGGYFYLKSHPDQDRGITVTFTEEEIQERLARKFPKTEMVWNVFPAVIDIPKVRFLGDTKRIELTLTGDLAVPFTTGYQVAGIFTSSLKYEQEDHTLRIDDVTVERIEATGLPEEYQETIRLILTGVARTYLDDHRVHEIDDKDYKDEMARMLLKEIKVKRGRLEVKLGL